ncbi:hypothetical protein SDD30_14255 [Moorella naiadis]|uniref:hypothetical protein n=1 Tax=Moorella naiadis (nom. illeg.) TaxID=3093670 RepID=UPI003D9C9156
MMLIIILPMLLLFMVGIVTSTQVVTESDISIQEGVALAAKAAAETVNPVSQANGTPRINSDGAHNAFRYVLARNLGLDQNTLAPLANSPYATPPRYWLVVYNGDDTYSSSGAQGARIYVFDGSNAASSSLPYTGFPAYFSINSSGITTGQGGIATVMLPTPGVVALVEIKAKNILGQTPLITQRWAAARIHLQGGI